MQCSYLVYLYVGRKSSSIVLVIVSKSYSGFQPHSFRALVSSRTSGQLSAETKNTGAIIRAMDLTLAMISTFAHT